MSIDDPVGVYSKVHIAAGVLTGAVDAGKLGKDSTFVKSLLKAYAGKGLSPKQEEWFLKMANKYSGDPKEKSMEVPASVIAQFEGVYALFKAAKEHLKFPKINLQLPDGAAVQLYLSSKGKLPGVINVTNGQKFGSYGNKWYGRVHPDGKMVGGSYQYPESANVKELLVKLALDPAGVAAAHGKLTGRCCFCNKPLSDEKSTAAGYGPVCAVNFGLLTKYKAGKNFFEGLIDAQAVTAEGVMPEILAEEKAEKAAVDVLSSLADSIEKAAKKLKANSLAGFDTDQLAAAIAAGTPDDDEALDLEVPKGKQFIFEGAQSLTVAGVVLHPGDNVNVSFDSTQDFLKAAIKSESPVHPHAVPFKEPAKVAAPKPGRQKPLF